MEYNQQTKIGYIWANEHARRILLQYAPELEASSYLSFIKMNTLHQYAQSNQSQQRPPEWADQVLDALAGLSYERGTAVSAPPSRDYEPSSVGRGTALCQAPRETARWAVFELVMHGPRHGNPYLDVELSASFSCGEHQVEVLGFYDGDGMYRIRLMPDREGQWSYVTRSNSRSLDGIEGSFQCTAADEGTHGPVRVVNDFHFAYEDGTRYVPVGTTCYAWTHQSRELQEETLAEVAASPFNKLRMCVFPKAYLFNENEPELYPFAGSPAEGWELERFNPAFFRHLEQRIEQLGQLGIEADLILFHAYDRWGFSELPPEVDDRYVRYITARLSAYRNVWWSLANEYDLMWAKEEEDWERFAAIIKQHDPCGHLLSIHNCFGFYDYSRDWVTHCSVQRIDVYRTAENTDEWRKQWGKPIVIDECAYEGNIDMGWGNISGEEMVRRFWEGAVRGGYVGHGETYLHPEDVLWWSKGGKLYGTSPQRIAFLRGVLEQGPECGLNPLRSEWDAPCAGIPDEYYLYYYGFNRPSYRNFTMKPGIRYKAEVLDTWEMTTVELAGEYEGSFRIPLPGKPYIAVRLTRAQNGN